MVNITCFLKEVAWFFINYNCGLSFVYLEDSLTDLCIKHMNFLAVGRYDYAYELNPQTESLHLNDGIVIDKFTEIVQILIGLFGV